MDGPNRRILEDVAPLSRRTFLKYAGLAAVSMPALLEACGSSSGGSAATSGVVWDGKPFDSGGARLNVGNWGGFWQDFQTKVAIKPFEKQFNCTINYDSGAPFYPKMAVAGRSAPPLDVYSFDQDTDYQNKPFIADQAAIRANCPNAADLWPFAFTTAGTMWSWSEMVHAYRTDLVKPKPQGFKSIFEPRFAGKRGAYIPENGIGLRMLIVANKAFGNGYTDWDAGLKALKQARPWKVVDFTGTMQGLLENGEVVIAPIDRAEFFALKQKGAPVDAILWDDIVRAIIPQQFGVAAGSKQLKLAYAFLNWTIGQQVQGAWASEQFWLPTNKTVTLPPVLSQNGFANTEAANQGLSALTDGWQSWFQNSSSLVDKINQVYKGA